MKKSIVFVLIIATLILGIDPTHWKETTRTRAVAIYDWLTISWQHVNPFRQVTVRHGKVAGVIDGDTIEFHEGEERNRVRLTDIDTPERDQPWGNNATTALSKKINGKEVVIHEHGSDSEGRLLGRIYLEDRDINRELVAEGHAWVYRRYSNDKSLIAAERSARQDKIGLWSLENSVPPWAWRRGGRGESHDAH